MAPSQCVKCYSNDATEHKENTQRTEKAVMKADRNDGKLLPMRQTGQLICHLLKHDLLPVHVSLAEINGTLRTGNNSELANIVTEDIDCPETIQLRASSSTDKPL